jgi:putative transposase
VTGLKKKLIKSVEEKRLLIDWDHDNLSIYQQCELLGLSRSSLYYDPRPIDDETLLLMRLVDEEYTRHPFYGTRKMTIYLRNLGFLVNRKRLQRYYGLLGLEAIHPKPKTSCRDKAHAIFPYLLRDVAIERVDQVWSTDITYIRLKGSFVYLVAIIDWFSRYVLGWKLSVSLEADFCIETLKQVLSGGSCEIFNTDQGSQFTTPLFTGLLLENNIRISMDGKGRSLDNIFVERLWRSLKYELIYLYDYQRVRDVERAIGEYFNFYNYERPHQSLRYQTPASVYHGGKSSSKSNRSSSVFAVQ